jgi:hypothetical protein
MTDRFPWSASARRRSRQEKAYAAEKGDDVLEAQRAAAAAFQVCCGEAKPDHHPACREYVEPVLPDVHPDQTTLA